MKRIILPTDFSENAYNAIRYAINLFKNEPCTFYLLNTYTPSSYYVGVNLMSSYATLELEQIVVKNSKEGLDALEERIAQDFRDSNHIFMKISSFNLLHLEINELIAAHAIDLVIMGTKGATGAQEILIGTETMHTIKRVQCPVIAVPDNFDYEEPKEILFATDFKFDASNRFLPKLKELTNKHGSRLRILNAYYGDSFTDYQQKNKDFLDTYFDDTEHVFHTADHVDVIGAIEEFQKKHKINFLAMIHNKHTFFENLLFKPVINQLAFHIKVPFMVIPSEKRIKP